MTNMGMASVRKGHPHLFFIKNLISIRILIPAINSDLLDVQIYFHRAVVAAHDIGMDLCFCNLVLDAV